MRSRAPGRGGLILDGRREVHDGTRWRPSARSTPSAGAIGRAAAPLPDRRHRRCRTRASPTSKDAWSRRCGSCGLDLDRDVIDHLTSWYGTEARTSSRFAAAGDRLERVSPHSAVLAAEIAYAGEARAGAASRRRRAAPDAARIGRPSRPRRARMRRRASWRARSDGPTSSARRRSRPSSDGIYRRYCTVERLEHPGQPGRESPRRIAFVTPTINAPSTRTGAVREPRAEAHHRSALGADRRRRRSACSAGR